MTNNNKEIQIKTLFKRFIQISSRNINNNNSDLSNITNKTDVFGPKISTDSGLRHWFLTRMNKE